MDKSAFQYVDSLYASNSKQAEEYFRKQSVLL